MVSVETISIVFTGLSVSLAAFYYISTLRNAQRNQQLTLRAQEQALETRQAQLFMQLYNVFTSTDFQSNYWDIIDNWEFSDFMEFMEKYGSETNLDAFAKRGAVGAYFEGMGVLVNRKLIDVGLVDDLISGLIIRYWEKMQPIMDDAREMMTYPQLGEWIEYLYNEIKPIAEEQHPELRT
jgi:hypothetical protein